MNFIPRGKLIMLKTGLQPLRVLQNFREPYFILHKTGNAKRFFYSAEISEHNNMQMVFGTESSAGKMGK
jgi:hypothetical protein